MMKEEQIVFARIGTYEHFARKIVIPNSKNVVGSIIAVYKERLKAFIIVCKWAQGLSNQPSFARIAAFGRVKINRMASFNQAIGYVQGKIDWCIDNICRSRDGEIAFNHGGNTHGLIIALLTR